MKVTKMLSRLCKGILGGLIKSVLAHICIAGRIEGHRA